MLRAAVLSAYIDGPFVSWVDHTPMYPVNLILMNIEFISKDLLLKMMKDHFFIGGFTYLNN